MEPGPCRVWFMWPLLVSTAWGGIFGGVNEGQDWPSGKVTCFYGLKPRGLDGGTCGRVVESEEGFNARQVISAEGCGRGALCVRRGGRCAVLLGGKQGEPPHVWAGVITPPGDYGFALRVKHLDGVLGEQQSAVLVAQSANANRGMLEPWHDVGITDRQIQVESA